MNNGKTKSRSVKIGDRSFSSVNQARIALNTSSYSINKLVASGKKFKSFEDAQKFLSRPREAKSRVITINHKTYRSLRQAAKELGISVFKLNRIIESGVDLNHIPDKMFTDLRCRNMF